MPEEIINIKGCWNRPCFGRIFKKACRQNGGPDCKYNYRCKQEYDFLYTNSKVKYEYLRRNL